MATSRSKSQGPWSWGQVWPMLVAVLAIVVLATVGMASSKQGAGEAEAAVSSTIRKVYIANLGFDTADGLTPSSPVRTIGKALAVAGKNSTAVLYLIGPDYELIDQADSYEIGPGQRISITSMTTTPTRVVSKSGSNRMWFLVAGSLTVAKLEFFGVHLGTGIDTRVFPRGTKASVLIGGDNFFWHGLEVHSSDLVTIPSQIVVANNKINIDSDRTGLAISATNSKSSVTIQKNRFGFSGDGDRGIGVIIRPAQAGKVSLVDNTYVTPPDVQYSAIGIWNSNRHYGDNPLLVIKETSERSFSEFWKGYHLINGYGARNE